MPDFESASGSPPASIHHVHLDAVGGVAGDMFVAALLDALPALRARVFADLAAVLPPACGEARLSEGTSGGIAVRRFALVDPGEAAPAHSHDHGHPHHEHHEHHEHEHHDHPDHHDHAHPDQGGHEHFHAAPAMQAPPVRFPEIVQRIESAALHPGTAAQAVAILRRLAEAESRMHGVPIEAVHFHEIADWDSLMDVVAAGSIAAALAPCRWSVSALPRGAGLVRTRHGLLPVPAPATAAILHGFEWRDDGVGGERVTPTGAAIVAHLVGSAEAAPARGVLLASGSGAGTRELPGMPNLLRALVFAPARQATSAAGDDAVIVVGFDIDDMSGEEIGIAADRLRAAEGVIDLTLGQRQGKKGRPMHDFRLLVKPAAFAAVCDLCFVETTTIGLRWRSERRICLPRSAEAVTVGGRSVARKRTERPGGEVTLKVESDELARLDGLAARRELKQQGEAKDTRQ